MSSLEEFTKGLKFGDETTDTSLLKDIIESKIGLNRKTKIDNALELAMLQAITNVVRRNGFIETFNFLNDFQIFFKELSVSQKGWLIELMSNTLSSIRQQKQTTFTNKMLGIEEK
jgi:hypothetical protein